MLNALSLFCCGVLSIPGIIVTALALGKVRHDLRAARTLVNWGWGLLGASVALWVVFIALAIATG